MKLPCKKCNTQITSSCYPVKRWQYRTEDMEVVGEEEPYKQTRMYLPRGSFLLEDTYFYQDLFRSFEVNPKSYLLEVPPFEGYNGCCNWAGEPIYCLCGEELGSINLDCWQPSSVSLREDKVRRVYK